MRVMHIALGGCLKAPPIQYGITDDTGGHIAYVLGAAQAQAKLSDNRSVTIVTRAFDDPDLGCIHSQEHEQISDKCSILRLRTKDSRYLPKEELDAQLPELTDAFLNALRHADHLPDIIHAHFADAAVLALAAEREFGIPFLYTPHSLGLGKKGAEHSPAMKARIAQEREAICKAAGIIVSSRDEAEHQVEAYGCHAGGRTHRVNPGVTLPEAGSVEAAEELLAPFLRDPDKPIVLAIARPVRKKNLVALINAFGESADLREKANLVIVAGLREGITGASEEQDAVIAELFDQVDRHDLWGHVALPRRHRPSDIGALYRLAAEGGGVFANPAFYEPFGLTLVEAVQTGLPFVATANGGPVDIADITGGGTVVKPEEPGAIAEACLKWLNRPGSDLQLARARRQARAEFNWDRWAQEVQALMQDLCAAPGESPRWLRRIVACDIDNTLTGCRDSAATFAAWVAKRDAGIAYLAATGRSISEARRVLAQWSLPEPEVFITSVGSEIWRRSAPGQYERCAKFAALLDKEWDRAEVEDVLRAQDLKPQPVYEQRRWKISYMGTAEEADNIRDRLYEHRLSARVVASHGRFIDVLPRAAGKANAIRFVAREFGLDLADCIACGDSGNDLDMLTRCGRAIVPSNAFDEIASLTRPGLYRSKAPHALGVLEGLEQLGMAQSAVARTMAE